jgi:hypothetical protein
MMDTSTVAAAMDAYFRGERLSALVFIAPIGALSIGFGAYQLSQERTGFSIGVALPFLLLGLVLLGAGLAIGIRTPNQVGTLAALLRENVAEFLAVEVPRMQKVNAGWPTYIRTWGILIAFGVVLRFGVYRGGTNMRAEWALGLGAALIFFGGAGLLIDGFAERRAKPYTAALEAMPR